VWSTAEAFAAGQTFDRTIHQKIGQNVKLLGNGQWPTVISVTA